MSEIIKEQSPKMVNGVHHSWTNSGGEKLYTFNVKFASGKEGEFSAKNTKSPWETGQTVIIAKETPSDKYATKFSLKKDDSNSSGSNYTGGSKSTYNDPKVVSGIAMGMCQAIAKNHFLLTKIQPPKGVESINDLAAYYFAWVTFEHTPGDRDGVARRYYALQLAVECIEFESLGIVKKEAVLAAAEVLLIPYNKPEDASV